MRKTRSVVIAAAVSLLGLAAIPYLQLPNLTAVSSADPGKPPEPGAELRICGSPALSPAGTRIAIPVGVPASATGDAECSSLYLADLQSPNAPRAVISDASYAAWSADGETIAFSRRTSEVLCPDSDATASRIGLYSWSTGETLELGGSFVDREPVWEPGGKRLAFARLDFCKTDAPGGMSSWIVLRSPGVEPRRVGPEHLAVVRLQWHPSAGKIAYIAHTYLNRPEGLPRSTDLYLLDTSTGDVRNLTKTGDISRFALDWSPDGRCIAFATGQSTFRTLDVLDVTSGKRSVALRTKDLGSDRIARVSSIHWSPAGDGIVFDVWTPSDSAGPADVGYLSWPDLRFSWLTKDGKSRAPCWSADGRVVFVSDPDSIRSMIHNGRERNIVLDPSNVSLVPTTGSHRQPQR